MEIFNKPDPKDHKIKMLEQMLDKLTRQTNVMAQRIQFLERENNRRKMDINQAAQRKG
jgi:hypothetical protein